MHFPAVDAGPYQEERGPLAAIGALSVAAFSFLVWIIYFNPFGGGQAEAVAFLPAVNASLNTVSTICLVTGFVMIKQGRRTAHRNFMVGAFAASTLFLISYIVYHSLHGDTPFRGKGWIRPVYFAVLISHIVLSAVALPLVLTSFFFSLSGRFAKHKKVSRFTFPLWLYVSVTGVLVFFMLRGFGGAT